MDVSVSRGAESIHPRGVSADFVSCEGISLLLSHSRLGGPQFFERISKDFPSKRSHHLQKPSMLNDEDDGHLCEKARDGCEQAFGVLFRRHYGALHAFVYRLCLDAAGAEDIVQDAFIKAARSLHGFRGEASFRNWLYRIAMNTTRDWQRTAIRQRQAAEEMALEAGEASAERKADFAPVHEALAALADEMRHAVVLVYYEGLNHAQAAGILGCAETTVSWRIFRAKRQLKNLLTRNGEAA